MCTCGTWPPASSARSGSIRATCTPGTTSGRSAAPVTVAAVQPVVIAAVQAAPVFLDRDATVAKACGLVEKAAADGAGLVVFPETFVPTYPDWVWRSRPWDDGEAGWYDRLF